MIFILFYIIILLITTIITLCSQNYITISEVYFYALISIGILDYIKNKSLTLFQVWQIAYIFIILSEAILLDSMNYIMLQALKYLVIANNILIFGYLTPKRKKIFKSSGAKEKSLASNKWITYLFVLLVGLIVYTKLPGALNSFLLGRTGVSIIDDGQSSVIISSLLSSISLVLPSIIVFYYKEIKLKKSLILPWLLSSPIFLLLFITGTRFPLLFSFGGFLIVAYTKTGEEKIKLNLKLLILIVLLFGSSVFMNSFRTYGYSGKSDFFIKNTTETRISKQIAFHMSPEGVIDMTSLMMRHFENNSHTYGKSLAFLTVFWIPRSLWPEKPTMLGYWLVRKYRSGFSEGHSSSFGFTGELYADFGYFSLFFVYILGLLLKHADQFLAFQFTQQGAYKKICAVMLFPYIFFFVRSPITSTINFLGILFVYIVMKKILFRK